MSSFEDRKKGQEAKFALDAELRFKAEARRNRQLGLWAAELMGLSGAEADAYAGDVVAADFSAPGDQDVFNKVSADLKARNVSVSDSELRARMDSLMAAASEDVSRQG